MPGPAAKPILKVVELFRRREDLSPAEFLAHWRNVHTDVVLKINGLRAYVQNPVINLPGLPTAPYDGAVEVWFDNLAVMRANARDPYWQEVVADEARFIDRQSRRMILAAAPPPVGPVAAPRLLALVRADGEPGGSEFRAAARELAAWLEGQHPGTRVDADLPILSSYDKPRELLADAVLSLRCGTWEQAEELVAQGALARVEALGATTTVAVAERVVLSET